MNKQGDFIWYELLTTDADAAEKFYRELVGWTIDNPDQDGIDYRILSAPDGPVGGLMQLSPEMLSGGAGPGWLGYIAVMDVDATVSSIQAAGGGVLMPPMDMEGVGRMAFVHDPQGNPFYVMRGASGETSRAFDREAVGHVAWNELVTTDQKVALDFYTGHFGWSAGDAMPINESSEYRFVHQGDVMLGAMMNRTSDSGAPGWIVYWRVPDAGAAHLKAAELGATLDSEPMEVPGGDHVFTGTDPQGARFAICGGRG